MRSPFAGSAINFPAWSKYRKAPFRPFLVHPMPDYTAHPMRDGTTIVVLEGDETGQELLEEALRVLAADVIGLEIEFPRFDLSLERRRATKNQVVHEAAAAIREHGLGLKAATVTPEARGDVGSPNRILREEIGGRGLGRTGRPTPGVVPRRGVPAPPAASRASSRAAASTRRSRSSAWRSATPTARRSGARATARTRSRSAPSGSSGASATPSPSSRSGSRRGPARRCSAVRSTPSAPP